MYNEIYVQQIDGPLAATEREMQSWSSGPPSEHPLNCSLLFLWYGDEAYMAV